MYRLFVLFFFVLVVAIGFGSQSLQLLTGPGFADEHEIWSVDTLQETTGSLWISPYGTQQKFMNILGSVSDILYIQTYDFTHKGIRRLVKNIALAGTDVRIMQENEKYQQYADTYTQVVDYFSGVGDVQIQSDAALGTTYLHTKLNLIDDRYIIQSANLTQSAFKNREYFFVGKDPVIWENLHMLFLKDREGQQIYAKDIHPNLAVCPVNCRAVVEGLIRDAHSSLRIQTQYIVDDAIMELLKQKIDLDVRIDVAAVDSNDELLYYFGPTIARYLPKPYVHAKMMLIDDRYLLIGSINMSATSMDENRELGIIVTDPRVISQFTEQFDRDWKVSKGKWR